jgi:hypothetical protein
MRRSKLEEDEMRLCTVTYKIISRKFDRKARREIVTLVDPGVDRITIVKWILKN